MQTKPELQDDQEIVEKVNYLTTVLIPSIRAIDNAIENDKQVKYLPRSLFKNLPKFLRDEIEEAIDIEDKKLNEFIAKQNYHFYKGTNQTEKDQATELIKDARIKHAKEVSMIVIDLLQEKVGLFQTRKKVAQGEYLDLYKEFGITPEKDDD